jgi:fructose-1,6-bisphosphatase/inositol monophosphatase family enzyme
LPKSKGNIISLESKICVEAVEKAGKKLKSFQDKNIVSDIKKWNKHEAGLVTEADLISEKIIIETIKSKSSFPILSEEATEKFSFAENERFWAVDPLCGTVPFSNSMQTWGLTVSFFSPDHSSVGAIMCPSSNEIIYCDYENVYKDGVILSSKPNFPEIEDMTICLEIESGQNWVDLFRDELNWIKNFSYVNSFASAVYPGSQIIKGNLPIMAIYKISIEHVGALILIGSKLGIKATDLKGNDLSVEDFKSNDPEWFIYGWPDAHDKLMNKINQ